MIKSLIGLILWLGIVGIVLAETLRWTPPVDRENGTALPPTDIYGYLIYIDGNPLTIGYGEEATISLAGTIYDDGQSHIVTLKTVDTGWRISGDSNSVTIPVSNPNAPGVCVVP